MRATVFSLLAVVSFTLGGCNHDRIPNTDVPDTSANREVIEFVEQYRLAVEARDVTRLLRLASEQYYDDNGTPVGHDDIAYQQLRERLAAMAEAVSDIRYEIRYRNIAFVNDKVFVDYTYTGNYRLASVEGDKWSRRLNDNRLVLERTEDDQFLILSGM